ncbi:MAG: isopentenyl-diphosphate Delta-isomerase [Xanthomonadales bacterium]|nr:isopentenyl-diphosphate Delta-isomerase [Xanthomonadales bacterium]
MELRHEVVSFDDEPLVLVDSEDREIGFLDKGATHDGAGVLHRAFSLFVFNSQGELLLQQRAPGKRLWPGFWANTCCSHPRGGEPIGEAIHRRLAEELGFDCELEFLYKFEYHARYGEEGSEHELCHVFAGVSDAVPHVNATEISALRHVAPEVLDAEMEQYPERFTPWLKLEWQRLRSDHPELFAPRP